ncbi:oxidoreductase [Mangrovibacillus sp. Mu-81]|uniref:WD40/YVTN/BNR-like repeat-containing protein n=1 Tax=Mangrovibacillus sp. Mu-81 TaxID=3121478 RepID=UPI002FE45210
MKKIMIAAFVVILIGVVTGTFYFESASTPPGTNRPTEYSGTQESGQSQPDPLQPIYVQEMIGYSLQRNQLQITYSNGNEWTEVPIEKGTLFEGEYSGNEQELIQNSFILTPERAAFLYADDSSTDSGYGAYGKSIKLIYSLDKGKTWEDAVITEQYPPLRFRKVEFTNKTFGYVIVSGDRTMSQEWTTVYLTDDGGRTWRETAHPGVTRLLYNGGFVDEQTGFLSFGILNPEEPDLHVTLDRGNSWSKAKIEIPETYHKIFVTAEVPFKEEDHLAVYLNQGPNGDYKGGGIKGKFLSSDSGLTWTFSEEVQPDETN